MFRHMPVPRDTSVSRQIIIVCCDSVGNCQTLSKDGPSQLVNSIIFRPFFFLFFASDVHRFLSYIHTRQPTNLRPMPTNFYGLVGYDRVKNYRL